MTKHAAGTFDIGVFEAEKPYDEHLGTAIARVHIEKTFSRLRRARLCQPWRHDISREGHFRH